MWLDLTVYPDNGLTENPWTTCEADLPYVFNGVFGANVSTSGASLIIIVSVILETLKQVESMMLVRNYKGFLKD